MTAMDDITQIIGEIREGREQAVSRLLAVVYDELHRLAARKLARERPGHTLQTTALVHEAYLRLTGGQAQPEADGTGDALAPAPSTSIPAAQQAFGLAACKSSGHFFAAAAEAMRRILIDCARRKKRQKRGGNLARVELDQALPATAGDDLDLLALDEALRRLASIDPLKAEIVKLRFFAGLSIEQTAAALDVSTPTVKRHWAYSRAWLHREISKGDNFEDFRADR
jgi:RNA polymerase sigma factor (sigma-70 family)